jgi:aspartyl-tRNA(Asn)/glutamyl-tRNA(Gln) amidotransferase subunit C
MRTDTSATCWGAEASRGAFDGSQPSASTAPPTSRVLRRWEGMSCEIYIGRRTKGDHYSGGRCMTPGKGPRPFESLSQMMVKPRAHVMPRIQPEEVREIAALARLSLDQAEVERMSHELDDILGYIDTVMSLDTGDAEPMTHAVPFDCPLREDTPGEPLPVDEALGNAPRREGGFFQVPRIIGGGPAEGM